VAVFNSVGRSAVQRLHDIVTKRPALDAIAKMNDDDVSAKTKSQGPVDATTFGAKIKEAMLQTLHRFKASNSDTSESQRQEAKKVVMLLTFPNTGTTMTLWMGQCLAPGSGCTAYEKELMTPTIVTKGPRASSMYNLYRDADGHLLPQHSCRDWCYCGNVATVEPPGAAIVKCHGAPRTYGDNPRREHPVSHLVGFIQNTSGPLGGGGINAFLRVWRNPYDILVSV
jgi:hypothetical protein